MPSAVPVILWRLGKYESKLQQIDDRARMAKDFSGKERVFIEALKSETGRDLEGWMTAIAGSRSDNRNDIIDWLRQQGFTFAHASWLERIHHNGGRLIYEGGDGRMPGPARRQPAAHAALHPQSPAGVETVDALIAAARAYRPLAQAVLRDILAAAPGAAATVVSDYVAVSHSQPFAALLVSPRDVRLFLAVGPEGEPDGWQRIKALNPPVEMLSHLSHMLVLTDARQLTAGLRGLIVESARSCRADSKRD